MNKLTMMVLVTALVGCGGDDSPEEQCDDLIVQLCDRGVECIPEAGTKQQCIDEIKAAIPCGSAKSVKPSYDRCMDLLDSLSCAVLFPDDAQGNPALALPADCSGVIQTARWAPAGDASPVVDVMSSTLDEQP